MSSYKIEFVKSAVSEFERLPKKIKESMLEALNILVNNPYSEFLKIKKLKGTDALYRIRIGDYRLVYEVREKALIIIVIKIGHRKDVYRFLD